MNKIKNIWVILSSTIFFMIVNAASAQMGAAHFTIPFQNRQIDISPYFDEFPYAQFDLSQDGTKLFYQEANTFLKWVSLNGNSDLKKGNNAIAADLSKQNVWSSKYNEKDGNMYWIGDENNNEIINIYRSPLMQPTKPAKLTNVPYIYAWEFNKEKNKIAYVGRMGQNEARLDELHVLDLQTMKDEIVDKDIPSLRYTWGSISWRPDDKGLLAVMLKDADRRYASLVYFDFNAKSRHVLTDTTKMASIAGTTAMEKWISNDKCLFFSDQDGFKNVFSFEVPNSKVVQLTHFKDNVQDARIVKIDNDSYLFAMISNPIKTQMMLLDIVSGEKLYHKDFNMEYKIGSTKDNKLRVIANNVTTLVKVQDIIVGKDKFVLEDVFDLPESVQSKLVQSNVERISVPTFDIDPLTGKTRTIHAYLFKPKKPLPTEKSIVLIQSFYGGDNDYDKEYQIYNQAGMYVLSPSPRGSAGFGRDFAAMNDGDLGGNEILDIIYCAKFISRKMGIPTSRIGCFGMSHGGYATMRLMTFPGKVNGHEGKFPFGFGIETAGFSDIIYQHTHSNIPDWTYLEAGDPIKDKQKLIDRSPLYNAEGITGPLLLFHGNHDNRVDIEGSRLMDRALIKLNKPHKYVEFEGLGHGIKGKENNLKYYSNIFHFLDDIENGAYIR